jgi:DNA-binding NarL/FixJ family response regulator
MISLIHPWNTVDMSVRCLIVDDHLGFLHAARKLLESGGVTVVGAASTSAEAVEAAIQAAPDVVLVDIALGAESGFDLARRLATEARLRQTRVILISTHAEEDFADLLAVSPAIAFLPKWKLSAQAVNAALHQRP